MLIRSLKKNLVYWYYKAFPAPLLCLALVSPLAIFLEACQREAVSGLLQSPHASAPLQLSRLSKTYSLLLQNLTPDQDSDATWKIWAYEDEDQDLGKKWPVHFLVAHNGTYRLVDTQLFVDQRRFGSSSIYAANPDATGDDSKLKLGTTIASRDQPNTWTIEENQPLNLVYIESSQMELHQSFGLILNSENGATAANLSGLPSLCEQEAGTCWGVSPQYTCEAAINDDPRCQPEAVKRPLHLSASTEQENAAIILEAVDGLTASGGNYFEIKRNEVATITLGFPLDTYDENFCAHQPVYLTFNPFDETQAKQCEIKILTESVNEIADAATYPRCRIQVSLKHPSYLSEYFCDLRILPHSGSDHFQTLRIRAQDQRF